MHKAKILVFLLVSLMLVSVAAFASAEAKNSMNDIEKVVFIHYKKGFEKNFAKHDFNAKPGTATCYKLMGVKWGSLPVSYVINPNNPDGLSDSFVTSAISTSAEVWDASTNAEVFNNKYGTGNVQYGVYDGINGSDFCMV